MTVGAEIDFSNRNAPVLRLSQDDIQSLVKAPVPIKSMVVKTLPKVGYHPFLMSPSQRFF